MESGSSALFSQDASILQGFLPRFSMHFSNFHAFYMTPKSHLLDLTIIMTLGEEYDLRISSL
jgi:hypothetical protein